MQKHCIHSTKKKKVSSKSYICIKTTGLLTTKYYNVLNITVETLKHVRHSPLTATLSYFQSNSFANKVNLCITLYRTIKRPACKSLHFKLLHDTHIKRSCH